MKAVLRACLREPLVHFAFLGSLVLMVGGQPHSERAEREIVVSREVVDALVADYERRFGAPPSPAERRALVRGWIDDEVLYREARALGLDEGDSIVRRRLQQKMEFLIADMEPPPDPDDAELERYVRQHAQRYRQEERLSFVHVFVRAGDPDEQPPAVLDRWRTALEKGADPSALGDPFPLGSRFSGMSSSQLTARFGAGFAEAMREVPVGRWTGPLRSAYGWHLVHVTTRKPARLPRLDEVRERVLGDWREEQRDKQFRKAMARLRARYAIRVEAPADPGEVVLAGNDP